MIENFLAPDHPTCYGRSLPEPRESMSGSEFKSATQNEPGLGTVKTLNPYFTDLVEGPSKVTKNSQLVVAATSGDAESVRKLLRKGAEVQTGNYRPLRGAAMNGHLSVINAFLASSDAEINSQALDAARLLAEEHGKKRVAEVLQEAIQQHKP